MVRVSARMGGLPVNFRVVGESLARSVLAPFTHLKTSVPRSQPKLHIDVWAERAGTAQTVLVADELGTVSEAGRYVLIKRGQTTAAMDRRRSRIVAKVDVESPLSLQELGRPFFELLGIWHQDQGLWPIHAGLIEAEAGGILVAGPSGSGKSTVCLRCLEGGLGFLGDDTVVLEESRPNTFWGHSLFASVQLNRDSLTQFPGLAKVAIAPRANEEDKWLVLTGDRFIPELRQRVRIAGILLPRVTGEQSPKLSSATSGEAMLRLAPSSLMRRHDVQTGLDALSRLVSAVPAQWLELGPDSSSVAECVRAFAK